MPIDPKYLDLETDIIERYGGSGHPEMAKSPRSPNVIYGEKPPSRSNPQIAAKMEKTLKGAGAEITQVRRTETTWSIRLRELREQIIGNLLTIESDHEIASHEELGEGLRLSTKWGKNTAAFCFSTADDGAIILECNEDKNGIRVTGVRKPVISELNEIGNN